MYLQYTKLHGFEEKGVPVLHLIPYMSTCMFKQTYELWAYSPKNVLHMPTSGL